MALSYIVPALFLHFSVADIHLLCYTMSVTLSMLHFIYVLHFQCYSILFTLSVLQFICYTFCVTVYMLHFLCYSLHSPISRCAIWLLCHTDQHLHPKSLKWPRNRFVFQTNLTHALPLIFAESDLKLEKYRITDLKPYTRNAEIIQLTPQQICLPN